jgi:hypothetical protein
MGKSLAETAPVIPFPISNIGGTTPVAAILQVRVGGVGAGISAIRIIAKNFALCVIDAGITNINLSLNHFLAGKEMKIFNLSFC